MHELCMTAKVITYRGKRTGILSPYREEKSAECGHVRNHPFFASAADDGVSVDDVVDGLRKGRFDGI